MPIIEVETPRGIRHRDTDTGKFASKAAFQSQVQLPAVQQFLPPKSGIGPIGEGDLKSPVSSLREILESISEKMTTLVALTRQSLGKSRDDLLGEADVGQNVPGTGKEEGGGQSPEPFKFDPGPKTKLALMLLALAALFKFSDKIIPVVAKALEIGKGVYNTVADFIDATKENLKGAITGPGTVIAGLKLFRVDLVKAIKSSRLFGFIASGFGLLDVAAGGPPGSTKVGLLRRIMNIFRPLVELGKTIGKLPVISQIGTFFGKAGGFLKMLGKLFLPLTIIIAVYDSIMGALDGYKESDEETWIGKIIDGLAGGITGLINSLIGIPLDFLKSALGWILGKMGFTGAEEALASFSFADIISDIIGSIFGYFKSAVEWLGTLFTDPVQALQDLWTGLVGEGGLLDILYAPIDAAIGWIMGIFGWDEPNTLLTDEEGEFKGLRQLAIDALMGVWNWIKSKLTFDIPGFDLPSLPNLKDMIYNFIGGWLPDPEGGWFTKRFYGLFPNLKKIATAFKEGGTFKDGQFVSGDEFPTADELPASEKVEGMPDDTMNQTQKEANAAGTGGTTYIDNSQNKGGDAVSADSYYQTDFSVDPSDETAGFAKAQQFNPKLQ